MSKNIGIFMTERPILFNAQMVRALLHGKKTQTRRIVKPQPPAWASDYWGQVDTYSGLSEPIHYWEGVHPAYEEEGPLLWPSEDKYSDSPQWDRFEGTGLVSPYGSENNCLKQADQLWVRETFYAWGRWGKRLSAKKGRDEWHFIDMTLECGEVYKYDAYSWTPQPCGGRRQVTKSPAWWKRPAIFMPRAASRITLEITGVRVERLQDISEADAQAEGCLPLTWEGKPALAALINWPLKTVDRPYANDYAVLWESINGPVSWDANPWVWVVEFARPNPEITDRWCD